MSGPGEEFDDCPFCEGRRAAEQGRPASDNPHPVPDAPTGSDESYGSDWYVWDVGYGVGSIDWSTVRPYTPDEAQRTRLLESTDDQP